jgi:hypothetical protein
MLLKLLGELEGKRRLLLYYFVIGLNYDRRFVLSSSLTMI